MKLIDKTAVVAVIKRIEYETNYEPFTDEVLGKRKTCKDIKDSLDTLEVKEVDLEKATEQNLWKPADGDDLPEIDREVIVLLNNGKVAFGHRPPEYWDGKDIITGNVTRNYVERYDKGLWNIPNVNYWLDVDLPKQED